MNVTYSLKARQGGQDLALLEQATRHLNQIDGPSSERAAAEWDRVEDDRGGPTYTLTLRDDVYEVQRKFSPLELRIDSYVSVAIYHLWGGLLKLRSDEQHRKVEELVGRLSED